MEAVYGCYQEWEVHTQKKKPGVIMLRKATFYSDSALNRFFEENCDTERNSLIYLVKIIIIYNPVSQKQEYHLIYSDKKILKQGQHMRRNDR